MNIQSVPEISTENWRVSIMAQNGENSLYKHGPRNASVMKQRHLKMFQQQSD
jgi:hypothetical protein